MSDPSFNLTGLSEIVAAAQSIGGTTTVSFGGSRIVYSGGDDDQRAIQLATLLKPFGLSFNYSYGTTQISGIRELAQNTRLQNALWTVYCRCLLDNGANVARVPSASVLTLPAPADKESLNKRVAALAESCRGVKLALPEIISPDDLIPTLEAILGKAREVLIDSASRTRQLTISREAIDNPTGLDLMAKKAYQLIIEYFEALSTKEASPDDLTRAERILALLADGKEQQSRWNRMGEVFLSRGQAVPALQAFANVDLDLMQESGNAAIDILVDDLLKVDDDRCEVLPGIEAKPYGRLVLAGVVNILMQKGGVARVPQAERIIARSTKMPSAIGFVSKCLLDHGQPVAALKSATRLPDQDLLEFVRKHFSPEGK